mmetsp:Transcript_12309/g.19010  ORF Transcript_12309/g.19010 Transcript_12309/m.19010 type:complete len:599 (+) Transcript_12309:250-2046(+)
MLGRALDAAANQQYQEQEQERFIVQVEQQQPRIKSYDAINNTSAQDEAMYEDDDSEDGSSFEDEDEEDEDNDSCASNPDSCFRNTIKTIRRWVLLIANVDDLWDSDELHQGAPIRRQVWCIVLFWFGVLATAYAVERSTFKLLIDRAGPFRLFSAQIITIFHILLMGVALLIRGITLKLQKRRENRFLGLTDSATDGKFWPGLGIPIVDVGVIALMDTTHLLMVVISGSHVPPTLTVILIQLTIPLTALFSQWLHPDGCCTNDTTTSSSSSSPISHHQQQQQQQQQRIEEIGHDRVGRPVQGCGGLSMEHVWGSCIITVAVLICLTPATISLFEPEWFMAMDVLPFRTAMNTWLYTLACVPAALSQLYKESTFLRHKQPPVDANQLNAVISLFQLLFLLIISPLVYGLQGLYGKTTNDAEFWTSLYPASQISDNFRDGWKCFWGTLEDEEQNIYPEDAECDGFLSLGGITWAHVCSIALIGVAVDKIVHAGALKIMFRGVSGGIILAVTAMYIYDMNDVDFNYGPLIDSLWLVCTILLIFGAEVYHRVALHDATFETVHPTIDGLYDEDDDEMVNGNTLTSNNDDGDMGQYHYPFRAR